MKDNFVKAFPESIELADGIDRSGIGRIQLLRTGAFKHPAAPGGSFTITPEMLKIMKSNFEQNVRRLDKGELAVDYGHESKGKAAGWIKSVEVIEDEGSSSMFIEVDWTEKAENAILGREWRFISADIDLDYKDNETNMSLGPVLLGAGLVNRPHIKGMTAIFSEEQEEETPKQEKFSMTPEEMMKKIGELEQKVAMLTAKLEAGESKLQDAEKKAEMAGDMEAKNAELSEELKKATAKIVELEEANTTAKKEAKFAEFLKDGKVLPSQKDAFMKMDLTLSEEVFKDVKLNLSENGSGKDAAGEKKGSKSVEDEIDAKAQELRKENANLTLGEAYSQVLRENEELRTKYEEQNTVTA